jgi:ATP-dependent DNA ligase
MYGTEWAQDPSRKGKVFLHDVYEFEGNPLTEVSYASRYNALIINKHILPKNFELVSCVPINQYPTVWDSCVVHDSFEGVVFRKSFGKLGETILREKLVVTMDGIIIGFDIGDQIGKYKDTLGAVKVLLRNGKVVRVGGGFTDAMRDEIWGNQSGYLDKCCEVKGNREFSSGSLRHPNFVRWREDKEKGIV